MLVAVVLSSFSLLLFAVVFLLNLKFLLWKPANYPPGPRWWPVLGNSSLLRKLCQRFKHQHIALAYLAKEYNTNVLGLKLGSDLVVVVSSPTFVKDVFMRDEFASRPDNFFIRLRCLGSRKGVTCTDGPLWQEHRGFTMRHLRDVGFGKSVMENLISEELEVLLQVIAKGGECVDIGQELAPSILSVLWAMAAGIRLQRKQGRLERLLELMSIRARVFDMAGGMLNQFPWLRFVAPDKSGYSLITKLNSELKRFITESIEEHKKTLSDGQPRDLIDSYLQEMNLRDKDTNTTFTEEQLVVTLLDLFIAGSQTTSSTLDFAFLVMIRYAHVQERVYQEILSAVGVDKPITLADRIRLPYTEAVLLEVQRLFPVVPIMGPRRALKDTTINGYSIPKETTILINQWTVHSDASLFPNPQEFLPERFLAGNASTYENIIPFGLGKRRCLGETLAKACIFLIFTGVIQRFRISQVEGQPEPSLEPLPGLTLAPQPYSTSLSPR